MNAILFECGFVLKDGKEPNHLYQDQAAFQKKLSDHLQNINYNNPGVTEEFVEDLAKYIDDKNNFVFALQNSILVDAGKSCGQIQDSLFHLFLGINLLQNAVANLLFEKLAELSGMDGSEKEQGDNSHFIRLIVKQFCCDDKLEHSEDFCRKMLDRLEVASVGMQQIVIGCLPEIYPDKCHPTIARALCTFINNKSPIIVEVCDALSSLNISMELSTEIENSVALATSWMKTEHLPVVVRCLFKPSQKNTEVVSTLRTNLGSTLFTKDTQRIKRTSSLDRSQVAAILEQLKYFIQIEPSIFETWIKFIRSDVNPENEVIDLFFILILHSDPNTEATADDLLRQRIKVGLFGEKSLTTIFELYHWAMKNYFDVSIELATKFVKCDHEMLSQFGINVYKNLYYYFDRDFKQIVVGRLLDHVESCKSGEIDHAIAVITELTEKNPEQMASFAIYIKRIINYLDCLALHQIRSVFSCLSNLACKGGPEGDFLQNDLIRIIQEQLSNSDLRSKRIGIVGSLMMVKYLTSEDDEIINGNSERALNILKFLHTSLKNDKRALVFFYDDVISLVTNFELEPKIETWIRRKVARTFLENYVLDLDKNPEQQLQFNLCGENAIGMMAINLYPLVQYEEKNIGTNISEKASPLTLCSQFRLLQINQSIYSAGDLEDVAGLLSCPIRFFQMEKLQKFSTLDTVEKNLICSTLFYTLNWFRELINAFSGQRNVTIRAYVISRLKSIMELEIELKKCLAINPGFRPPLVNFDTECFVATSIDREIEESDKQTNKKQKETVPPAEDTEIFPILEISSSADATKKSDGTKSSEKEVPVVDLSQYVEYFRELDFGVFNLLKEKLHLTADSQLGRYLTPREVIFLLEDLKSKLQFRLQSRERPPFNRKGSTNEFSWFSNLSSMELTDFVESTVDLIPHLCLHMESASYYFQNLNAEAVDSAEYLTDSSVAIASILKLILESLSVLFSWKEFDQHQEQQQRAVRYLANQLPDVSHSDTKDCVAHAFDYIMKFSESLSNFSCALALLSGGEKLCSMNYTEARLNILSATAKEFLRQEWFDNGKVEHGSKYTRDMQNVFASLSELNSDPVKSSQTFSTAAFPEITEDQIDSKTENEFKEWRYSR